MGKIHTDNSTNVFSMTLRTGRVGEKYAITYGAFFWDVLFPVAVITKNSRGGFRAEHGFLLYVLGIKKINKGISK